MQRSPAAATPTASVAAASNRCVHGRETMRAKGNMHEAAAKVARYEQVLLLTRCCTIVSGK
jgi:hypothetical protein